MLNPAAINGTCSSPCHLQKEPAPSVGITTAQRWHLEFNNYVVVENALASNQIARIREALCTTSKNAFFTQDAPCNTRIRNCNIPEKNHGGNGVHFTELQATINSRLSEQLTQVLRKRPVPDKTDPVRAPVHRKPWKPRPGCLHGLYLPDLSPLRPRFRRRDSPPCP